MKETDDPETRRIEPTILEKELLKIEREESTESPERERTREEEERLILWKVESDSEREDDPLKESR